MKGIGTTLAGVIISLLIIIAMVFVIFLIFTNMERQRQLNLEETQIIRAKNLFYLFNKSLSTTWRVSSAQVIFASEDVQDYWYRTDPSRPKSISLTISPAIQTGGNIYVLGDSLTVGYQNAGLETDLQAKGYQDIAINGKVSRTLEQGLDELDNDVQTIRSANIVIIALGTNPSGSSDQFSSQVSQAIGKIKSVNAGATIYWISIYYSTQKSADWKATYDSYNNVLSSLSTQKGFQVISLQQSLGQQTVDQCIASDPGLIHPSNCYGQFSGALANALGSRQVSQATCDNANDLLVYVDKQTALPSSYVPSDLVAFGSYQVRSVVLNDLNSMISAAQADGISLFAVSAYRSYSTQQSLFESYVQTELAKGLSREEAEQKANTYSARAGHSEHQLGTTIDFNSDQDSFAGTREQQWLEQHAEEYGFVLSYPKGKEHLTGYQYEPWHYRYVGKNIASELKNLGYLDSNDWTLNKYLRERCSTAAAQPQRCSNGNPQICLPNVQDVSTFMQGKMSRDYIDTMKNSREGDIEVNIEDARIKVLSPLPFFWIPYGSIVSKVSETIFYESSSTLTVATGNENKFVTDYRKMLHGGWLLVDMAIKMSGNSNNYVGNRNQYIEANKLILESYTRDIKEWLHPVESDFTKNVDLMVPTEKEGGILAPQSGLILHYIVNAKFKERAFGIASNKCTFSDEYNDIIEEAVQSHDWKFDIAFEKIEYSDEIIISLVKAMIQQESGWNPNAESGAGAVGLMQVVPQFHPDCGTAQELMDPKKNIECGVKILNDNMDGFTTPDEQITIEMALAAYNCGGGCTGNAIDQSRSGTLGQNINWEKAKTLLPTETQNYIPAVLRCFGYYEGEIDPNIDHDSVLRWPAQSRTVNDCFGSTFGITEGLRSGPHKGIDINGVTGDSVFAVADGEVAETCKFCGNYGNYIIIKHSDQLYSQYAHLSQIDVEEGDNVKSGQKIGEIGVTGGVTGPHLHFEIRKSKSGDFVNPCQLYVCSSPCDEGDAQEIDYTIFPSDSTKNIYYYHDESAKRFVKKPFSLDVKIEDYIPALDCSRYNDRKFNWQKSDDLLCKDNKIWSCSQVIPGLAPDNRKSGNEIVGSGNNVYKCVNDYGGFCKQGDDTRSIESCCTGWTGSGTFCNGFCAGDGLLDANEGCASPDSSTCPAGTHCVGTPCDSRCEAGTASPTTTIAQRSCSDYGGFCIESQLCRTSAPGSQGTCNTGDVCCTETKF